MFNPVIDALFNAMDVEAYAHAVGSSVEQYTDTFRAAVNGFLPALSMIPLSSLGFFLSSAAATGI
jgi:hypothetical protein